MTQEFQPLLHHRLHVERRLVTASRPRSHRSTCPFSISASPPDPDDLVVSFSSLSVLSFSAWSRSLVPVFSHSLVLGLTCSDLRSSRFTFGWNPSAVRLKVLSRNTSSSELRCSSEVLFLGCTSRSRSSVKRLFYLISLSVFQSSGEQSAEAGVSAESGAGGHEGGEEPTAGR